MAEHLQRDRTQLPLQGLGGHWQQRLLAVDGHHIVDIGEHQRRLLRRDRPHQAGEQRAIELRGQGPLQGLLVGMLMEQRQQQPQISVACLARRWRSGPSRQGQGRRQCGGQGSGGVQLLGEQLHQGR